MEVITVAYKAVLGVGFPLHKPYPYILHRLVYLYFRYLKCLVHRHRMGRALKRKNIQIS